mmetsp:Transcript_14362/g.24553  ORF Transcript_14362/g.24553 Transcript_14362/m.24553 type:complete len:744 (-) Transcript_14362:649-2880(-)
MMTNSGSCNADLSPTTEPEAKTRFPCPKIIRAKLYASSLDFSSVAADADDSAKSSDKSKIIGNSPIDDIIADEDKRQVFVTQLGLYLKRCAVHPDSIILYHIDPASPLASTSLQVGCEILSVGDFKVGQNGPDRVVDAILYCLKSGCVEIVASYGRRPRGSTYLLAKHYVTLKSDAVTDSTTGLPQSLPSDMVEALEVLSSDAPMLDGMELEETDEGRVRVKVPSYSSGGGSSHNIVSNGDSSNNISSSNSNKSFSNLRFNKGDYLLSIDGQSVYSIEGVHSSLIQAATKHRPSLLRATAKRHLSTMGQRILFNIDEDKNDVESKNDSVRRPSMLRATGNKSLVNYDGNSNTSENDNSSLRRPSMLRSTGRKSLANNDDNDNTSENGHDSIRRPSILRETGRKSLANNDDNINDNEPRANRRRRSSMIRASGTRELAKGYIMIPILTWNVFRRLRSTVMCTSVSTAMKGAVNNAIASHYKRSRNIDDEYHLHEKLGEGAFAVVRRATRKATDEVVAIKVVNRCSLNKDMEASLQLEITILRELRHDHIMRLDEAVVTINHYYLVAEYLQGGELFDRIVDKSSYNESEARDVCQILFGALHYMHSRNIAHRDLKPENLLLLDHESDSEIKIADFGFAKEAKGSSLKTMCGTPGYVAPEILGRERYGTKVDMWSMGIIIFIMIGGYPPFYHDDRNQLLRLSMKGEFDFDEEYWGDISMGAKDMIRSLIEIDPTKRASAEDILSHP